MSAARGNQIVISHAESGAGLPVVLIHGFPHDHTFWSQQFGGFVDHCRCIAPDLRGFGESFVAPPYTIDQYADDVIALLDRLSIDRAVIGGLSMGGYIAFSIWRRHRSRVRALMLLDTRAGADAPDAIDRRRAQIELVRTKGRLALADALLPAMLGDRTRARHPALGERVKAMMARQPLDGIVGAIEAMIGRADSTPTLATIDVPTLIVCGAEDAATPPAESERMRDGIAGSVLEIIDGAGHLSPLERPAAVNRAMSEFLARLIYP